MTVELQYKILMENCFRKSAITFTKNIGGGASGVKRRERSEIGHLKIRNMTVSSPI